MHVKAFAIIAGAALALCACGGGGHIIEAPPTAPKKAAEKPAAADAYRDFGGASVSLGEPFRLRTKPIGVRELEIVIELVKTEWTTRELPDGRTVKDGTADLLVRKGEGSRRFRLEQGESREILGAKITLKEANEGYDEQRLDYMPWVDVVVTKP